MTALDDLRFMDAALAIARSGLGKTAPNPSVGCVLAAGGQIVGTGRTADGGRPHAETEAIKMAGDAALGATAYVTLEPCAHVGQTPPCALALIAARVSRIVVACRDPDKRVSGRGIAMLQDAGIEVLTGVRQTEAETVNRGFFLTRSNHRPYLGVDINPVGYDVLLEDSAPGDLAAYLKNLVAEGITRAQIMPHSPLASALRAENLLDFDQQISTTAR